MLSANNLYWFCYVIAKSAVTMRTIAIAGAYLIFGLNSGMGTAPGIGIQIAWVNSSSLPSTMPGSGTVMVTAIPALGIRGSI